MKADFRGDLCRWGLWRRFQDPLYSLMSWCLIPTGLQDHMMTSVLPCMQWGNFQQWGHKCEHAYSARVLGPSAVTKQVSRHCLQQSQGQGTSVSTHVHLCGIHTKWVRRCAPQQACQAICCLKFVWSCYLPTSPYVQLEDRLNCYRMPQV